MKRKIKSCTQKKAYTKNKHTKKEIKIYVQNCKEAQKNSKQMKKRRKFQLKPTKAAKKMKQTA